MATSRASLILASIDQQIKQHKEAGTPIGVILVREEDWLEIRNQREAFGEPNAIEDSRYRGYTIGFAELTGDEIMIIQANGEIRPLQP